MKTYQFCPLCAGKLKEINEELLKCTQCEYNYYVNPKACNGVILENKEGKILLVKRKYPPQEGMWDLPGGFIGLHESAEESVRREIKEELGAEIADLVYRSSGPDTYVYQEVEHATLGLLFTGKIEDENLTPQDDISDYKFFAFDEIPFDELAFESLKKALKSYIHQV